MPGRRTRRAKAPNLVPQRPYTVRSPGGFSAVGDEIEDKVTSSWDEGPSLWPLDAARPPTGWLVERAGVGP
jgi:hypothetical protein